MYEFAGINRKEQPTIEAMTNQLARCRTGREGYILRDGLSLGFIDSAVLDRREQQPLLTGKEDQTVWVFCSGTIFNISDLKKELTALGHDIQSGADAETLVHSYRQWGMEMLQRLNGQFALCLFDQSARKLFLARDRFGFKPLYYAFENGRFVFGSQLKAVMYSGIDKTLDAVSLNHYLYFGYMPTGRSIFQKVYPLQPAHFLIYDLAAGRIEQINRYWFLSFQQGAPRTEEDIAAELADRLGQSVRMRMVGQAPAGVFLSGGLDSSIIVSLMREQTETIKTFSIRFDRPDFDETHFRCAVTGENGDVIYSVSVKVTQKVKARIILDLRTGGLPDDTITIKFDKYTPDGVYNGSYTHETVNSNAKPLYVYYETVP
ncbi:MAG TPA: asparagine synthase-related protein, partial [Anaerohalosphaeraceae bacterium]|nr:asparagine synthase-related protein [Anaerohalosphaeraceae bacterium]